MQQAAGRFIRMARGARKAASRVSWGGSWGGSWPPFRPALAAGGIGAAILAGYALHERRVALSDGDESEETQELLAGAGKWVDGLPVFTEAEVEEHKTPESRIWVTYGDGVYDISEFVLAHPGGESRIMMAAGGSIEPFWNMYAVHKSSGVALKVLESLRVGNLKRDPARAAAAADASDPFASDPKRHPALKVNSAKPFNAETPLALLTDNAITPNDLFYVRNHLPVPEVAEEEYVLEIRGKGIREPLRLTLQDLRTKFPRHEVTATVQCAGNRRTEMNGVREVKGLGWTGGAIGTASWVGVRLADVLRHAGYDHDSAHAAHVHFEGLDKDMTGSAYGASVPLELAASDEREVVLAYEMNGEPLPRDHGFPVRAVIPGVVGARNVKWLGSVTLSDREYDGFWQQSDYKGLNPCTTPETVNYENAVAIQELPVQSAITEPARGAEVYCDLDDDRCTVLARGYAWSGGGRGIARVDVSADGGDTWAEATLQRPRQSLYRSWAWTLWEAELPVPKDGQDTELVVKAVDVGYNAQPESFAPIWNMRGVLSNAWHRVPVRVVRE